MLRRKISFDNITRYLFCAECIEEENIYKDDEYLAQKLVIKNLSQYTAIFFVTEHLEVDKLTKSKEYIINKSYAEKGFTRLTGYLANKDKEKVFLYYKVAKEKSIKNILSKCGQGNLIMFLNEKPTADVINKISEVFSLGQYIISYESYGDKIFALYNKFATLNSVKYLMHYTTQCQIGAEGLADVSISVNSFDVLYIID